jgi:hypothetical protein
MIDFVYNNGTGLLVSGGVGLSAIYFVMRMLKKRQATKRRLKVQFSFMYSHGDDGSGGFLSAVSSK